MSGPSPYILDRRRDLLLIVGSPVLALLLVLGLAQRWSSESIWAVVITFGAVGHHLPGFIRTYGDRELFAKYRWRFILAPPLVFAASYGLARADLHALLWVSLAWSIWHGMMQHYGFMRIYDAKAKVPSSAFSTADLSLTVAVFALCLAWGPEQGASVLDGLYACGVHPIAPEWVTRARHATVLLLVAAIGHYLVRSWRARSTGHRHAPMKLWLTLTTLTVLVVARIAIADPYLGVTTFEILHDVQYLTIVWAFERRRSRSLERDGWLTRRWPIYVMACLAYGAIAWSLHQSEAAPGAWNESTRELLTAFLATSALLHYYYDGFIWKVRHVDNRQHLGLSGSPTPLPPPPERSALLQGVVFGLAGTALVAVQMRSPSPAGPLEQARSLAEAIPESPTTRRNYASALLASGNARDAIPHLETAVDKLPGDVKLRRQLLETHLALGELDAATQQIAALSRLAPDDPSLHRTRAKIALRRGHFDAAAGALEFARAAAPNDAGLLADLGFAYLQLGKIAAARKALEDAVEADPTHGGAWLNLGLVLARAKELPAAIEALRRATLVAPDLAAAHNSLGGALMMNGQREAAIQAFRRALQVDPNFVPAQQNLRRAMSAP